MKVYGNDIMSRQHVTKGVKLFKEGRTEIHDEEKSGRPLISDEMKPRFVTLL